MSSKLKKVLKHSLSAKTHLSAVAQQRGGEACGPERQGKVEAISLRVQQGHQGPHG